MVGGKQPARGLQAPRAAPGRPPLRTPRTGARGARPPAQSGLRTTADQLAARAVAGRGPADAGLRVSVRLATPARRHPDRSGCLHRRSRRAHAAAAPLLPLGLPRAAARASGRALDGRPRHRRLSRAPWQRARRQGRHAGDTVPRLGQCGLVDRHRTSLGDVGHSDARGTRGRPHAAFRLPPAARLRRRAGMAARPRARLLQAAGLAAQRVPDHRRIHPPLFAPRGSRDRRAAGPHRRSGDHPARTAGRSTEAPRRRRIAGPGQGRAVDAGLALDCRHRRAHRRPHRCDDRAAVRSRRLRQCRPVRCRQGDGNRPARLRAGGYLRSCRPAARRRAHRRRAPCRWPARCRPSCRASNSSR